MTRRLGYVVAASMLAVGMSACGGGDGDDATTGTGGGGELAVEILEPGDAAELGLPFTLELDVSVDIGPPESGLHHVHLFFDGDLGNFEIIDTTTWEVAADSPVLAGVEPGERVLNVAIHTANHEPTGAEDQITVTLTDAGTETPDDNPGYDY